MLDLKTKEQNNVIIEVDITNNCNKTCSNCTRFCGHYTKERIYNLDLEYIENIFISLSGYGGRVGLIGGEPTLHPKFIEICELMKKYINMEKRVLFSNNRESLKYTNYFKEDQIYINEHNLDTHFHAPILVSSKSIKEKLNITDENINNHIDKCWIQNTWSAGVNPKGAYFCEVAGMLSYLYNGPDGLDIKEHPNWWTYDIEKFKYQLDWACQRCGCALNLVPRCSKSSIDDISEDHLEELKKVNSPKINKGNFSIYDDDIDNEIDITDPNWHYTYKGKNKE
jgi:hypothetical protein